jgi:hypothetical protein
LHELLVSFPKIRAQRLDFGSNNRNNFHRVLHSRWTSPDFENSVLITRSAQWRKRQISERFTLSPAEAWHRSGKNLEVSVLSGSMGQLRSY